MTKKLLYVCLMLLVSVLASCKDDGDKLAPFVTWNAIPNSDDTGELTTKTFVADDATEFSNPERGMYVMTEVNLSSSIGVSVLQGAKSKYESLVQIMFYLTDRISSDLTADDLAMITRDFSAVREAGLKAIVRFAYSNAENKPDAPMSVILRHLDQLKPVLEANKDVIACVQAGFIGSWGEWYYSSNGLNNAAGYKQLLDKYLSVLPSDRMIQVRTPKYKKDYLGVSTALTEDKAYNGSAAARLAHHNDAFMANETDLGTYADVTADKQYISQEGLYLPVGGETCLTNDDNPTISSGADAVINLRLMRWSFLHDGYDKNVLNKWTADGVMTDIHNKLGYRIALQTVKYSSKAVLGGNFSLQMTVANNGWAAMYNPRNVEVILRAADGTEYVAQLNEDPRKWKPGASSTLTATMALPTSMAEGTYGIFIFLPDAEASIHDRPEYAVRLANQGVWEEKTGYNDLGVTVQIAGKASTASTASISFAKK